MVLKPSESFLTEAFTNNSFDDRATDFGLRAGLDNSFSYLYRLQRNLIQYEEYFYTTRNQVYTFDYDEEGRKVYYKTIQKNEYGKIVKKRVPIENPEFGDFYFDDKRRVCINFGVQLIPPESRERYRDPDIMAGQYDFYGKEISQDELLSNPEIFHRIPVIIMDNKVLRDFSLCIYEDYFTLILTKKVTRKDPITNENTLEFHLDWYFMHGKNSENINPYDEENQESIFSNHKFTIQVIENMGYNKRGHIGFLDFKTNKGQLKNLGDGSYGVIPLDMIERASSASIYRPEEGSYFATVFLDNNPLSGDNKELSGTLLDVDVNRDHIKINFDKKTIRAMEQSGENLTVRFIFYRHLYKHKGYRGNFIGTHDKKVGLSNEVWSDVFMIQEEELKDYPMAIPKENIILFKVNKDDVERYETWTPLSHDVLSCYYPNIYQIRNSEESIIRNIKENDAHYGYYYTEDGRYFNQYDEYLGNQDISKEEVEDLLSSSKYEKQIRHKLNNLEVGDEFRAYYFYYPGYDLHFENMYKFFYTYLYCKWGKGSEHGMALDEIINAIIFEDIDLNTSFSELDPEVLKETVVAKEAVIEILDGTFEGLPNNSTAIGDKVYDLFLEDITIEDLDRLQELGIVNVYLNNADFNDAEIVARIIYNFTMTFDFIVFREITHYHYDDIDYLKNIDDLTNPYAKSMTSLEYRVKRLKDFISDDPEVLRKYVLAQNKVSMKYDFVFERKNYENMIRVETEDANHTQIPESYLFMFERFEESNFINYRIFIDGFIFTDYLQVTIGYQDYIYIPVECLKEGDFVEIETFPVYSYKEIITFSEENKSVIIDFPESEYIKPTLSDLYFKSPYNDNEVYDKNDFQVEMICEDYNYYKDGSVVDVWIPKKDKKFHSGVFIDLNNEDKYVPIIYQNVVGSDVKGFIVENDEVGTVETYYEYAKYINRDEEVTNRQVASSELDKMIQDGIVELRPDGMTYQNKYTNEAYRKNGELCRVFITAGFAYYVKKEDIPKNLVEEVITREVYLDSSTGDYFAQSSISQNEFYLYNEKDFRKNDEVYTREYIVTQTSYNLYTGPMYKIDFGSGYYTENGNHYTTNGQRDREGDISIDALNVLIRNRTMTHSKRELTSDLLLVHRDNHYVGYDKAMAGETVLSSDNKDVVCTPMKKMKITILNEELYKNEEGKIKVEVNIRKDSIFEYSTQTYDNYPCVDIGLRNQSLKVEKFVDPKNKDYWMKDTYYNRFYHYSYNDIKIDEPWKSYAKMDEYNKELKRTKGYELEHVLEPGSDEFIRVFRKKNDDGARLQSKNKYELLLNEGALSYGYPRVQMLQKIEKGEKIIIDVTPYRNRLVYFSENTVDESEEAYDGNSPIVVDLRGYISKPFDLRYYEVYLNGRRIGRNNIFPISPFMIRIAGVHSTHNLEIYEKDRDWEYYGCDYRNYYLLNNLLLENFMEDSVRDKLIEKLSGTVPDNHICEDTEDVDRDLNIESVFIEIFYYNRLIPLGLANADTSSFVHHDIRYNFQIVYDLFYRYMSNTLPSNYYTIEVGNEFTKLEYSQYNYTGLISDGTYSEIVKHERLNGLEFVIYKGKNSYNETVYHLYSGKDLKDIEFAFEFNEDFIIDGKIPDFHMIYARNLYIITTDNENGIYCTSEDGKTWFRRRAQFTVTDNSENKDLILSIYLPSILKDSYVFFGAAYTIGNTREFFGYVSITSYDGLSYHWKLLNTFEPDTLNMTKRPYFNKSSEVVYFTNETYTNNGYEIKSIDILDVLDVKKNALISVSEPKYLKETNGFIYSGKNVNDDINFNYTIFSKDGVYWNKVSGNQYITDVYYTNGVWMAVQLNKGDNGEKQYKFIYSYDGITFANTIDGVFDSFDEFLHAENGLFIRCGTDIYAIQITKEYTGPESLEKEPSHVLLLDPDVYYEGDDVHRWNVYMTGNDDEFMENNND